MVVLYLSGFCILNCSFFLYVALPAQQILLRMKERALPAQQILRRKEHVEEECRTTKYKTTIVFFDVVLRAFCCATLATIGSKRYSSAYLHMLNKSECLKFYISRFLSFLFLFLFCLVSAFLRSRSSSFLRRKCSFLLRICCAGSAHPKKEVLILRKKCNVQRSAPQIFLRFAAQKICCASYLLRAT